ncbi:MAG: hypothetical protein OET79_08860 [Nitrospirota bacterium]|nr:hypothetical protein [Nitrospirota bacterium]
MNLAGILAGAAPSRHGLTTTIFSSAAALSRRCSGLTPLQCAEAATMRSRDAAPGCILCALAPAGGSSTRRRHGCSNGRLVSGSRA